ncbi:hypothetical protein ACRAWF_46360 [Streptomyces sp. L7]
MSPAGVDPEAARRAAIEARAAGGLPGVGVEGGGGSGASAALARRGVDTGGDVRAARAGAISPRTGRERVPPPGCRRPSSRDDRPLARRPARRRGREQRGTDGRFGRAAVGATAVCRWPWSGAHGRQYAAGADRRPLRCPQHRLLARRRRRAPARRTPDGHVHRCGRLRSQPQQARPLPPRRPAPTTPLSRTPYSSAQTPPPGGTSWPPPELPPGVVPRPRWRPSGPGRCG